MRRVVVAAALVACTRSSGGVDAAPSASASPLPIVMPAPEAQAPVATVVVPDPPRPRGKPVQAKGKRSAYAAGVIERCKTPPPVSCSADADCAMFDIETWDSPCASTLRVGINASKRAAYLASAPSCNEPAQANAPPCVVHWDRAEDGPHEPPGDTQIAVRCVSGACMTAYFQRH